eukprot:gene4389-7764_t
MSSGENETKDEKQSTVVHPQAWLREKYAKSERREKPKDEILFYKLYAKPLETPEDIKRYREERMKNYPTKKNIEKKKELEAKKVERGDLPSKVEKSNKGKKKKNLLNQLIEKEMNREKDCILQSLRFIVKNDFYCENLLSERVKKRLKDIQSTKELKTNSNEIMDDETDLKNKINSIQEEIELLESEEDNEEEEEEEEMDE